MALLYTVVWRTPAIFTEEEYYKLVRTSFISGVTVPHYTIISSCSLYLGKQSAIRVNYLLVGDELYPRFSSMILLIIPTLDIMRAVNI